MYRINIIVLDSNKKIVDDFRTFAYEDEINAFVYDYEKHGYKVVIDYLY